MTFPVSERRPLSENERNELGKAILGFGNLQKVVQLTGISEPTIKHAVGGFNLNPPTRKKIRKFLKSQITTA